MQAVKDGSTAADGHERPRRGAADITPKLAGRAGHRPLLQDEGGILEVDQQVVVIVLSLGKGRVVNAGAERDSANGGRGGDGREGVQNK